MEALLREGRYCADIRIAKGDAASSQETKEFFDGKVSVHYSVKVPNTGFSKEVNLGDFDPEKYGSLHEGGFAFRKFAVEVEDTDTYRSTAYIVAVFEGDEEVLEQAKLGVNISEWGCK
ncbi:hypothetical protein [Halospina sp. K52047b]|uniref:hypothetical protein n=1 Tax=Halospina sp. K52047b TaxID=2614160 RepID=UPI00124AD103|nr:hypothetical protein [Halospina sp. K52047b]KAA8983344.1 hypothetical protein F3089_04755 [Halospina sp. K52047b]